MYSHRSTNTRNSHWNLNTSLPYKSSIYSRLSRRQLPNMCPQRKRYTRTPPSRQCRCRLNMSCTPRPTQANICRLNMSCNSLPHLMLDKYLQRDASINHVSTTKLNNNTKDLKKNSVITSLRNTRSKLRIPLHYCI